MTYLIDIKNKIIILSVGAVRMVQKLLLLEDGDNSQYFFYACQF